MSVWKALFVAQLNWFFEGEKFAILLKLFGLKQNGQVNFLENFLKNCHISRKKVMKSLRFLKNLGRFLAFFFETAKLFI
jgi:hypothetical protein